MLSLLAYDLTTFICLKHKIKKEIKCNDES